MFDEIEFDRRIIPYWEHFGLTERDFHCRECGELMLDFTTLGAMRLNKKAEFTSRKVIDPNTNTPYVESEHNRWLVSGRTLSGKTYFRHICWDCFFKHLGEIEDIPRRARKSSWYKDILNGNLRPPAKCVSPSKYFKIVFDITDEELAAENRKFDTASLESFIRRHGDAVGRKKYEDYKNRQAYTCSKEYMMKEKGMTEQDWNDFNANRACTKVNFINRYGEDLGSKKWAEYCDTESYVGCKLEYFVEKYGQEEGTKKYLSVCKQKYQCLDNYIRKYGETEGKARWSAYAKKPYSRVSQNLFAAIDAAVGDEAQKGSHYFTKNGESYIRSDKYCKGFHVDYLYRNKVIEFNGDYWHCNPLMYKEDEEVKFRDSVRIAKYVWAKDAERKDILERLGYDVKVVWESDYCSDPEKTLEECVEFIGS